MQNFVYKNFQILPTFFRIFFRFFQIFFSEISNDREVFAQTAPKTETVDDAMSRVRNRLARSSGSSKGR